MSRFIMWFLMVFSGVVLGLNMMVDVPGVAAIYLRFVTTAGFAWSVWAANDERKKLYEAR